ncbi:phenylacetate--CoA ligase family protein [Metabacillus malikii]|uniref:Phenylacetate-CoA ligase n=1 Tax=Metabacillus malikii TaxID=1504265 RepID=A0ABT9Z9Y2_9BACI|nr:phenylacetate--CoA ligase family protein [Metabacillus malikii]MDQ0229064.1 phenylacetate-CoA ligase [Metabacillus malikii]
MLNPLTKQDNEFYLDALVDWFQQFDEHESIEKFSRAELNEYHAFCLSGLLQYVTENSTYYAKKFNNLKAEVALDNYLEFFEQVPFSTKDEIRTSYKDMHVNKDIAQVCKSTGTTGGPPTYIGSTYNDLNKYYPAVEYKQLLGKIRNSVVANALPYEMSSSGLIFHHSFQNSLNCNMLPVGKGGAYSDPKDALQFMKDWDINVLVTTPTYAIILSEIAERENIDLREFKLDTLFLTGEGTSDSFRKRIEKIWNCKTNILFGSLEAQLVGIECSNQNGIHLAEGNLYVEVINPQTGEKLDNGMIGEIVVTTLIREGMPLIRYRTGDIGYLDETECTCGVTSSRLVLRGRIHDQLVLENGSYSPFYLEDILMRNELVGNWYKFHIENKKLTIEVEPSNSEIDKEEIADAVINSFEFHLNEEIHVIVNNEVERAYSGKVKRIYYTEKQAVAGS